MSVEDVQEINKMAQELLRHRIVTSRDDAVREAERMLSKKLVEPKSAAAEKSEAFDSGADRHRIMIERTKEHMDRQMAEVRQELAKLYQEIIKMKEQMAALRNIEQRQVQSDISVGPREAKRLPDVPAEKRESHPKRGDYTSNDVAIEKIFYYGNK